MSFGQPQSQGYSGRGTGPRAGFWLRFGAALTDGIILGLVDVILRAAFKTAGSVIGIVIAISYYVVLEGGPRGQTLGKQMMKIRVIDTDTGHPIGYGRAFVRYIGRILSAIVILLGYLWMLWDTERQCWHDKLASDYVVPISAYPIP
ncbi:MAG TPA: RDD family protein [Solirubrobacteraceae bacterium]|jgi:uncharacterized RDD family membrane protein YckC|nr:RDD family protein [Solirubrobacteraceae bacterium]